MKRSIVNLLILVFVISSSNVFSQDKIMENRIEKIKVLGKDSIIKIASNILETKYPTLKINLNDFEITAWSSKKEILVSFKSRIEFTPQSKAQSNLNHNLSINLITEHVSPLDIWGIDRFYIPTEEEIQQIEFVKKAFNLPRSGFDNKICEKNDRYEIRLDNDASFGIYYIDKTTGEEVISAIEGSYDLTPGPEIIEDNVNDGKLIEIKE